MKLSYGSLLPESDGQFHPTHVIAVQYALMWKIWKGRFVRQHESPVLLKVVIYSRS
jgi:hypothetical protein